MPRLERDGASHYYRASGRTGASGRGSPPLVFVHGFGGDSSHWDLQARAFGRTHRIVRVDLRGFGRSDAPPGTYDIAAFADDLGWMLRRLRLGRSVVVGHSMGGLVALQLAADRPERVRGVVMVDSLISAETRRELRSRPTSRARYPFVELFDPDFDRATALRIAKQAAATPPHVARPSAASVFEHDTPGALRALRVPALFVAPDGGGRDPRQARRALDGTDVWFGQAVGSGHYVMLEVPDQFNAMLRRFLASLTRRRGRASITPGRPR